MIIIEKEYSTRQTSCRTWLHVQHVFFHPSILVNEDYLTNLEILWTPLGNISQCKVRFSRSWIFCPLDIAAPPTFPPSCENFGTSDMKVPYFLPPMDKRLQGNNGGASESQCLGVENPDGRKTKTCLGRIHPFFGVRANKMPIRSPECFLIWVWKIVDPQCSARFYDDWSISSLSNWVCLRDHLRGFFSSVMHLNLASEPCHSASKCLPSTECPRDFH